MRAMIAGILAKGATWLMHFLIGWIKGETPASFQKRKKLKGQRTKFRSIY